MTLIQNWPARPKKWSYIITGMSAQRTLVLFAAVCLAATAQSPERVQYGKAETSFGELTVPPGAGPFPIIMLMHGGCWASNLSGLQDMRPMSAMLAGHGIAAWNVEYRRVGHPGGGWPGSFRDVSDAFDYIRELARTHPLNLNKAMVAGHSSGGYFAAWIAGRHNLPKGSPLVGPTPLKPAGLVLLDAFLDPQVVGSKGVDGGLFCAAGVMDGLIGGKPEAVPGQLLQVSPLELLPFGIPQTYVVSSLRYPVTPARPLAGGRTTYPVPDYPALARKKGDKVTVELVPEADHMDFVKPSTKAWAELETALVKMTGR